MTVQTSNQVRKLVREKFGTELEIVDAKKALRLQPLPQDTEGAEPCSPDNCVLVHTAARMFGSKAAVFWKTAAYIDLVGKDGIRRVERFKNPFRTIKAISAWDQGRIFVEGGLELLPPALRATLKNRRKSSREHYHSGTRKILYEIDKAQRNARRAEGKRDAVAELASEVGKRLPSSSPRVKFVLKDLKAAEADLRKRREELINLQTKADEIRTARTGKGKRAVSFDLTTRNGAMGHYKFGSAAV